MDKTVQQTSSHSFSKKESPEFQIDEHRKNIKKAQLLLLCEALLIPLWSYFGYEDASSIGKALLIWGGISLAIVYMAFSFYVSKKPYTIMLAALCMYAFLLLLTSFFDSKAVLSEFVMELIIMYTFYEGLREYKPAEKWVSQPVEANN